MTAASRAARSAASDTELLASIANGDLVALGTLFDRHEPRVRGHLARMGIAPSDIDDLVQATFLELMRVAHRFHPESSAISWLLGIASMMVRRHRRSFIRSMAPLAHWIHIQPDRKPTTPAEDFESNDVSRRFQAAFESLSSKKREVFALLVLEGLSGEEAARALDIPINTVWTRLHHARQELRVACRPGGAEAMKSPACPRSWQDAALEDGRLSEVDRASFMRHTETCTMCTRELDALSKLRDAARSLPRAQATPLERRRQRNELLRRAHEQSLRAPPALRGRTRPMALVVALSVLAVATAGAGWLFRSRESIAKIHNNIATSEASAGPTATLATAVAPSSSLPMPEATAAVSPRANRSRPRSSAPERGQPGPDFAKAMAAFSNGDYALAEGLFTMFARHYPEDTRAEDAAFLRAVSRSRRGDPGGARALAYEYLTRYPSGLRRLEAERLADDPNSPAR